jgi:hypothetical protein
LDDEIERAIDHLAGFVFVPQNAINKELYLRLTRPNHVVAFPSFPPSHCEASNRG